MEDSQSSRDGSQAAVNLTLVRERTGVGGEAASCG